MTPHITAGELKTTLENVDDDARIRLDISVLADVYACSGTRREVKAHEPDDVVLLGYAEGLQR